MIHLRLRAASIIVALLISGLVAQLGAADQAAPATPPKPAKSSNEFAQEYERVVEWRGSWDAMETETFDKSGGAGRKSLQKLFRSSGRFVLKPATDPVNLGWFPADRSYEWRGEGTVVAENTIHWEGWDHDGMGSSEDHQSAGTLPTTGGKLLVRLAPDYLSVSAGWPDERLKPGIRTQVVYRGSESQGYARLTRETDGGDFDATGVLLPLRELDRLGGPQMKGGGPRVFTFSDEDAHDGLRYTSHVTLFPVFDDVEVEVTIKDYEKWRPLGSIDDPKKPGNGLVAHAELKSKSGKNKTLPPVDRFRFELLETSREPGVCLNWPLEAKDDDYDLKFADFSSGASSPEKLAEAARFIAEWGMKSGGTYDPGQLPAAGVPTFSFGEVSANGQKLELIEPPKDAEGRPFADAAVESFDFGGRAELRVVCVLKDGREIIGLIKTDGAQGELVRLPKMNGPGWIAENWRKEHDVEKHPDNDDQEKIDGQPMNGDGFTLYEEYRGWAEKGKHVEGDPAKKDFFVLNLIGGDIRRGIDLFAKLSKFRVHARLYRREMSQTDRLMNGNHRDAPHRVDQHGVWIKQFGSARELGMRGGATVITKAGVAGRPGIVTGIGLLARDDPTSVFVDPYAESNVWATMTFLPYKMKASDLISSYDLAVAHELFHSVGVEHHGEGNYRRTFFYQHSQDPMNPTQRARFVAEPPEHIEYLGFGDAFAGANMKGPKLGAGAGRPLTLLMEGTAQDIAVMAERDYERSKSAQIENGVEATTSNHYNERGWDFAARHPRLGESPQYWADRYRYQGITTGRSPTLLIGVPQGEDSGSDQCVMRYYFAMAYPEPGQEKGMETNFILIPPGTNPVGLGLCTESQGAGVNGPPKSRHGAAASGYGACMQYICPNDAIAPRVLPKL